jgi:15-cis-phytoene synthase
MRAVCLGREQLNVSSGLTGTASNRDLLALQHRTASPRAMGLDAGRVTTFIRRRAKSFHLASLFLPKTKRRDVQVLYAYFRRIDDVADVPGVVGPSQVLDEIESQLVSDSGHDWLINRTRRIAAKYDIAIPIMLEIIEGARLDLDRPHFTTFDELYRYADLVAGSVGACLCHLLGDPHSDALVAARRLGIAMQLTNILRDVGEDLENNRCYLPAGDLARFGLCTQQLACRNVDEPFRELMRHQIERARGMYADGLSGLRYLDPSCRLSIAVAATLYAGILSKIESMEYDVFVQRAHLNPFERLLALPKAVALTRRCAVVDSPCPAARAHIDGQPWRR